MGNVNDFNKISSTILNDSIQSTSVNDYVDAIDTVSYSGQYSDYAFILVSLIIADQRATETTDDIVTLMNIEYI